MKYWVLPDSHLGHDKMHEFFKVRPKGFEDTILANVDRMVKDSDVLIHLGDFCIGKDSFWHEKFSEVCKCKRWLIKGNHDNKSFSWYYRNGWDCVVDSLSLNMFGRDLVFSHVPIAVSGEELNIHGHFHNTDHHPEMKNIKGQHRLVFIEHDYEPFDLRKIVESEIQFEAKER